MCWNITITYNNYIKGCVDLKQSSDKINPYGGGSVKPKGTFIGTVKCEGKITKELFYVVPGRCGSLLSVNERQHLGLIKIASHVLCSVSTGNHGNSLVANKIIKQYSRVVPRHW